MTVAYSWLIGRYFLSQRWRSNSGPLNGILGECSTLSSIPSAKKEFCVMILCPETLPNLLKGSHSLWGLSNVFYAACKQTHFSFSTWTLCVFSFLTLWPAPSVWHWQRWQESGPCLADDKGGRHFAFHQGIWWQRQAFHRCPCYGDEVSFYSTSFTGMTLIKNLTSESQPRWG